MVGKCLFPDEGYHLTMGVKLREKLKGSGDWWLFIDHKGQRKAVKVGSKEVAKAKEIEAALTLGKPI